MNQWSRRRKRIILVLVFFVLIFLIGLPIFLLSYRAPTCFDSKQNGNETGIDCGGSCQLLCTTESLPLVLKGDPRVLKISNYTFELVAVVENANPNAEIYKAGYTFKLYDNESVIPVATIEGETYVPKGSTFALFEGPFDLEAGVNPTRATLEWKEKSLIWKRNILPVPELKAKNLSLSRTDTNPRLDAVVENASLENVSNIDLVALLSDGTGNIFAASKTFLDTLPVGGSAPVVFNWPRPFDKEVLNIDIVIRIFPDTSFIR